MSITDSIMRMRRDATMKTGRFPTTVKVGTEVAKWLAAEATEAMTFPRLGKLPKEAEVLADMKEVKMTLAGMRVEVCDNGPGYWSPGMDRPVFDPRMVVVL